MSIFAHLDPPRIYDNGRQSLFLHASGKPRLLLVHRDGVAEVVPLLTAQALVAKGVAKLHRGLAVVIVDD